MPISQLNTGRSGESVTSGSYFTKRREWRRTLACPTVHSQKIHSESSVSSSRVSSKRASFWQPKDGEKGEGDFDEDPVVVEGRPRVPTVRLSPTFLKFPSSRSQSAPLICLPSKDPIPGSRPSPIDKRMPEKRRTKVQQESNISEPGVTPAQFSCTCCVQCDRQVNWCI